MADHWVPQCYLRNFEISEGSEQVYTYERGRPTFPAGIKNVAAENNRHTFVNKETGEESREVEDMFTLLEGAAAPALQKIAQERVLRNLNGDEYGALLQFVAFLATRGPTFEQISRNFYKEAFKLEMETRAQHPEILRKDFEKAGVTFGSEEEFEELKSRHVL